MGRTRDADWPIAVVGLVMMLAGGFFGRSAPGLWLSAIRYANAPRCATPDQRDCVQHLAARVSYVDYGSETRFREHMVAYSGGPALTAIAHGRPARVVAPDADFDRLALGAGAPITVRVWERRVTSIGREGFGSVGTWSAPWNAAVQPTAEILTGILAGLALLAVAGRRPRAAIASGVAAAGAHAPVWLTDRLGRTTAPEALAVFLVAVTGTALLLSFSRTGARASPPRPRAAPPAAR